MKDKVILTVVSLLFYFSLVAQKKGDNTIIIDTVRTISDIKLVLFNNGYNVENSDTLFLTTTAKQMKTTSVLRLMIARVNNNIIIKGQRKLQVELVLFGTTIKEDFMPVEYSKSKNNLNHEWFEEMNKIANGLGGKITYLKQ